MRTDATAGATARQLRERPDAPRRIRDSTDPRFGQQPPGAGRRAGDENHIIDATDPHYGKAA
jgi:hypothetical protein